MGGILFHLVEPNPPINQLFIFSLSTSQPQQSYYTVTWLPLLIQSDTYFFTHQPKISTYCINELLALCYNIPVLHMPFCTSILYRHVPVSLINGQ